MRRSHGARRRRRTAVASRRVHTLLAGVALGLAVLAGCGGPGDEAFDAVRELAGEADRMSPYSSWEELTAFASSGEDGVALVVAQPVEATEGAAFTWSDDGMERTRLPLDSEEAMIRTVHLLVEVERVVGEPGLDVAPGQRVMVGLAISPDADAGEVADSLEELPTSLFFLRRSPVFDYEDGLVGVLDDGLLVAVPDGDGDLGLPALPVDSPLQPPDDLTLDLLR